MVRIQPQRVHMSISLGTAPASWISGRRITYTCGNAQSAQNYVVRIGWYELRGRRQQKSLVQVELPGTLYGRGPTLDIEFAVSAPQMTSHGAGAHVQVLGHLGIGEPLGDEGEDF